MFGFLTKLFKRPEKRTIPKTCHNGEPVRVKSLVEKGRFDNIRKSWSVYGTVVDKDTGLEMAVIHWQGWEDAGWKLKPVSTLDDFSRTPSCKKCKFYYLGENKTCHQYDGKTHYPMLRILGFKQMAKNKKLMAWTIGSDWRELPKLVDVEHLYDIDDPQSYQG